MKRTARWPAHGFAALLSLVVAGSVRSADETAAGVSTLPEARAALARQIEQAVVECSEATRQEWIVRTQGDATSRRKNAPARRTYTPTGHFPRSELMEGHQALLVLSYLIDELGNPRFVHVAREVAASINDNSFDQRAVSMMRRAVFDPAIRAGVPVAEWNDLKVAFIIQEQGRMGSVLSEDKLTEYVIKARAGDLRSQTVVAYLHSIAPLVVGISEGERRQYVAAAAAVGERSALADVTRLLGSPACKPSPEVEGYLYRSAMAGRSDIEMLHAARMLERGNIDGHPEVLPMLRGAANADDAFIRMWAAGILATAPVEAVRDPEAALAAARTLDLQEDPDASETLAAALAANGQYREAVAAQQAAITAATRLHWKVGHLRERLARYKAGKPWTGYLCDCDVLVPNGGL
jgi:hypothetical protein